MASKEIVLIGAPGSGRSNLAQRLQKELENNGRQFKIVDEYFHAIDQIKIAKGQVGDYHVNIWVHYLRYHAEQWCRYHDQDFITVGSDVETLAHQALYTEWLGKQLLTPQAEMDAVVNITGGQMINILLQDYFGKDYAWYVPLQDLPDDLTDEQFFATKLDVAIRSIIQTYKMNIPTLLGTVDEKVQTMVDLIENKSEIE